jgi:AraC-like DNA-binding protein
LPRDYLRNHLVLATRDLDAARESVRAASVHAQLISPRSRFFGLISNAQLRNTGLSYYRWSAAELKGEATGKIYCLQMHESGEVEHEYSGRVALATPSQAVLLSSEHDEVHMRMRPSRSFAVRIDRRFVDAALRRRFQRVPPLHQWAREFPLDRGPGASLRALVRWLADELDRPGSALNDSPRAIAHIEKAIRALLLDCLAQIYPRELRGEPTVVPASLERIEEWMDANIEEAIGVEDMAAVAGISVRAVQAAFRRYRDCTPSEAVLVRRLQRARALLLRPAPATTVTGVAFDVGLCHLGRFAARYAATFGESPSETLAAARLGLG